MAVKQRKLEVVIAGDQRKFSKALDTAGARSKKFGGTIGTMGKKVGKVFAGIGLAAGAIGFGAFKLADDFDQSMRKITGLVGLPKAEVDKLRGSVLDLAGDTAKSPQELAEALFSITSAGFSGQEALEVLERSSKAAAAGLGDTQQVALTVGAAVNAFGKENLSAAEATDILVGTVKAGNLSAEELASALGKVLPIASAAGVGLDEVGASVALITRSGASASEAVTQVKSAIQAMNAPTKRAAEILEKAGISSEDLRSTLADDGLVAAMGLMEKAAGGDASVMRQMFGSSEALSGALTILNGDSETVTGVFDELANATGLTDAAFESASDTAGFKLSQAFNKLKAVGIELGSKMIPVVAVFAEKLLPVIDQLIPVMGRAFDWIEDNVFPVLQRLSGFVQETKEAFDADGLGGIVETLKTKIGEALPGIMEKLGEWAGAFFSWLADAIPPMLEKAGELIVTLLGWVADQMPVLRDKLFDEWLPAMTQWLSDALPPLLEKLGTFLTTITGWLLDNIDEIIIELVKWGAALVDWIATDALPKIVPELLKFLLTMTDWIVTEGVPKLAASLLNLAAELASWVGEGIVKMVAALPGITAAFGTWFWGEAIPTMKNRALAMGSELVGFVSSAIAKLPGKLVDLGSKFLTEFPKFASKVKTAALNLGKDIVKWIIDGMKNLPGQMANKILGSIPGLGTNSLMDNPIVQNAINNSTPTRTLSPDIMAQFQDQGGVVSGPIGSPQWVLAHGGETVLPSHRGDRGPIGQPGSAMGSSGGLTINISAGAVVTERGLQEIIIDAAREAQRNGDAFQFVTI